MNNLISALCFGGILTDEELKHIGSFFEVLNLKAGEEFLAKGRVSNRIGFLDEGVLRVYSVGGNGEEVTKYFVRKNQFAVNIESFYDNKPSDVAIQAVIPSRVLAVPRSKWNKLYEEIPKLYLLTKSLTEAALINKIKDNDFLNFGSAKVKYLEFIKRYPDLSVTIPQQYIASYLRITPQSLSRIRRELV